MCHICIGSVKNPSWATFNAFKERSNQILAVTPDGLVPRLTERQQMALLKKQGIDPAAVKDLTSRRNRRHEDVDSAPVDVETKVDDLKSSSESLNTAMQSTVLENEDDEIDVLGYVEESNITSDPVKAPAAVSEPLAAEISLVQEQDTIANDDNSMDECAFHDDEEIHGIQTGINSVDQEEAAMTLLSFDTQNQKDGEEVQHLQTAVLHQDQNMEVDVKDFEIVNVPTQKSSVSLKLISGKMNSLIGTFTEYFRDADNQDLLKQLKRFDRDKANGRREWWVGYQNVAPDRVMYALQEYDIEVIAPAWKEHMLLKSYESPKIDERKLVAQLDQYFKWRPALNVANAEESFAVETLLEISEGVNHHTTSITKFVRECHLAMFKLFESFEENVESLLTAGRKYETHNSKDLQHQVQRRIASALMDLSHQHSKKLQILLNMQNQKRRVLFEALVFDVRNQVASNVSRMPGICWEHTKSQLLSSRNSIFVVFNNSAPFDLHSLKKKHDFVSTKGRDGVSVDVRKMMKATFNHFCRMSVPYYAFENVFKNKN